MWNKKSKVYSKIGLLTEKWAEEEKKGNLNRGKKVEINQTWFCAHVLFIQVLQMQPTSTSRLFSCNKKPLAKHEKGFWKNKKFWREHLRNAAGIGLQNLSMWTFEWECWFLLLSQSDFWEAKKGRKQMKSVKAPSSNKFHLFSLDCCLLVWKQEQFNCSLTDFTDCWQQSVKSMILSPWDCLSV